MLTEGPIDVRLVAATITSVGLEPGNDVRVEPQRNLLRHRPVENSAPGIGPIENLRGIGRVDLVVGQPPTPEFAPECPLATQPCPSS